MAVLGDVRQPTLFARAHGHRGDIGSRDVDLAALRFAESRDRLNERALAIPFHAGDTKDFVRLDGEGHVVHGARPALTRHHETAHLERRRRRVSVCVLRPRAPRRARFARIAREHDVAANHRARDRGGTRPFGLEARHRAAGAHDRDHIRDLRHLIELVGDEDDRAAIVAERAKHAPELLHLWRGKNSRRLIEDENARAAHERLQDLDSLLLADAQLAHVLARVHPKPVSLRRLRDLALRAGHVDREAARRLAAEDDVFGDRECGDEHEVLVHHPDARADRRAALQPVMSRPETSTVPSVGWIDAGEDAHHRRLAGAVLADQRVDLPGITSSDASRTAWQSPKRFAMPVMRTAGAPESGCRSSRCRDDECAPQ